MNFDANKGLIVNGEHIAIHGVGDHADLGALGAAFNTRAAQRQLEILQAMGANAVRFAHNPPAPELLDLTDRMAPIMFPVAMKLGIDPVHFGIIMVVNMEVGMCHPPVGLNLYVASGIARMGITELTIAVWPWLLTMLVFLVIVTYMPIMSLWLPKMLGMM